MRRSSAGGLRSFLGGRAPQTGGGDAGNSGGGSSTRREACASDPLGRSGGRRGTGAFPSGRRSQGGGWYGVFWRRSPCGGLPSGDEEYGLWGNAADGTQQPPLRAADDGLTLDASDYTEKAWEAMSQLGPIADKLESAYVEAEMLLKGKWQSSRAQNPLSARGLAATAAGASPSRWETRQREQRPSPLCRVLSSALLDDGSEGLAQKTLERCGVSTEKIQAELERHLGAQPRMALGFGDQKVLGRGLQQVLSSAQRFKREFGVKFTTKTNRHTKPQTEIATRQAPLATWA